MTAVAPVRSADVEVLTFGCRLNLVESEAIRRAATAEGRKRLTVVNTCGVTAEATRQARQAIRRARRADPERTIVATGCAVAIEAPSFAAMSDLDAIIPNSAKTSPETWRRAGLDGASLGDGEALANPLAEAVEEHTRAFLAIQNGCNHDCTFCAIPLGRGRTRSAPVADVIASARRIVERGFREIVLTGVDLTSWGEDLPSRPRLGALVRSLLAAVPDLRRLRLSSLDCIEADDHIRAAFADEERLMPYLHLSLQSGDDLVLKRMKRRHSRADAVAFCAELRRLRPDMAFGADLIAGFPTETEAMAAATRALVDDCGLSFLHVFPFSPRPGTPAARMPAVPPALVKERAARLREHGTKALRAHLRSQIGRTVEVLAERGGQGRAPDFTPVATSLEAGTLRRMVVCGHDGRRLHGSEMTNNVQ